MIQQAHIQQAVRELQQGRLVIIPTDTVYGVAADPTHPDAMARLLAAKERAVDKPIALLAADRDAIEEFGAQMNQQERRLADEFWPGALTLILSLPRGGTEGFRIPDLNLTRDLLQACGGVLRVSSANRSGAQPALTATAAAAAFPGQVALVLDAGPAKGGAASSVVQVVNGAARILREDALSRTAIENALQRGITYD